MSDVTQLFRYQDSHLPDEDGRLHIGLCRYTVIAETPCGYRYVGEGLAMMRETMGETWLKKKSRWVSKTARARRCYPTLAEAWESYVARKKSQCVRLRAEIEAAEKLMRFSQTRCNEPPKETLIDAVNIHEAAS